MRKIKEKTTQGHKVKRHEARSWYNKYASELSGRHLEGENLDSKSSQFPKDYTKQTQK